MKTDVTKRDEVKALVAEATSTFVRGRSSLLERLPFIHTVLSERSRVLSIA